jgi:hypothetical protein
VNNDLLDEYCEAEFGHTDWAMNWDADGNLVITFHKEPTKEYCSDFIVDQGLRPVRMRKDLEQEGLLIPAGRSYKDYDDLQDVIHLSAEDLEGAYEYDTSEDPDSHAFCPVKLRDGQVVYMIGVDLEWFDDEEEL